MAVQHDGPAFRGKLVATVDIIVAVRGHRLRVLDSTLIEAIKVNKIRHNTTIYIIFFYSRRTRRRFSYPYSYRRISYPHLYLLSHFFPSLRFPLKSISKGSEDQPLPLIVYNCDTREEREVELLPTRKWKGEGEY